MGFNKADDAGVYRINEHQALVQTVDFFPPIVDDPYAFGQIAAANALSDIFAMGGRPLTALNIVGFPLGTMPLSVLTEILRGGNDKIEEAGAVVVGGHSIKDKELKYGVSVTGIIDIAKIVTNSGARPGDKLFLTKPLGTGIITTAIKRDRADEELIRTVIASMSALNSRAAELMVKFSAHAATDITGFGLLGHAYEMASGSDVTIKLWSDKLPILQHAVDLAGEGMIPGGAADNREYLREHVRLAGSVPRNTEHLLYDPQTSGGLLIAIPQSNASEFGRALKSAHIYSQPIGEVVTRDLVHLIVE